MISSATRRLALLAGALVLFVLAAGPAGAEPPELPEYHGAMVFETIFGPGDPEEYSWKVRVLEGQELKLIDDQHAEVLHESGHSAVLITAEPAHDAEGKAVPTSIAITADNVITLTVHHTAGNPAVGGAPFHYPVTAGTPYETGYSTVIVVMPPGERVAEPAPTCIVPDLLSWKLKATRHWLRQAQCGLGKVRGVRRAGAQVVKQSRAPGTVLPAGARVAVKLG